jgi:Ca-activated chloride channel family protein
MKFLSPARLLLLFAPLALAAAYVVAQRTRQRYALRFSSVELLASVAPSRPGWQRHVAPAAIAAAMTLLIVGFARPAHAARVPRQRATVILALDTSASMGASDIAPSRLVAAEQSAQRFVRGLPKDIKVGLVSFDRTARVVATPTADRAAVLGAIGQLQLGPGTATGDAIYLSLDTIKAQVGSATDKSVPAAIVLMSDGTPTIGRPGETPAETVAAATAAAKAVKVPINTIAFGTSAGTVTVGDGFVTVPVPFDPQAMTEIAQGANGKTFSAQTAGELKSVYSQIGRLVGYDTVTRELTAGFTGVGIFLLMAAAGAALWWTQRIV